MKKSSEAVNQVAGQLPQELVELSRAISELPEDRRTKLEGLSLRVIESTQRRKRILNLVQEALSQLRLDMKYLMFDLEATRRERDALQQRLDEFEEYSRELSIGTASRGSGTFFGRKFVRQVGHNRAQKGTRPHPRERLRIERDKFDSPRVNRHIGVHPDRPKSAHFRDWTSTHGPFVAGVRQTP